MQYDERKTEGEFQAELGKLRRFASSLGEPDRRGLEKALGLAPVTARPAARFPGRSRRMAWWLAPIGAAVALILAVTVYLPGKQAAPSSLDSVLSAEESSTRAEIQAAAADPFAAAASQESSIISTMSNPDSYE